MKDSLKKYLIAEESTIFDALKQLNNLTFVLTLFVVDRDDVLTGSITDGDIRRSLLKGVDLNASIKKAMNPSPKYLIEDKIDPAILLEYRKNDIKILPIINHKKQITDLINLVKTRTMLPLDAVIMAGGKGIRLLPLTQTTPKPLLPLEGKPILGYAIERLKKFGIRNIHITVNYLEELIREYVGSLQDKDINIKCISEDQPYGTIGSLSLINDWQNDTILLTNSDLLTTIDYEDFYMSFIESKADLMVAVMPYPVKVPYGIIETDNRKIIDIKEKPEYIFHANTGIYMFKKSLLSHIPSGIFYNATDLIEKLIKEKYNVCDYSITGYWLDIGRHDEYKKAQEDVKHLQF